MIISWDIGIKNLAFAILDINNLYHWEIISLNCKNCKKISKCKLIPLLYDALEKNQEIQKYKYDYAIIESQVSKNPKAGCISSGLQMWLITKGIKTININAKKKFLTLNIPMSKIYKERKNMILQKCIELFNNRTIIISKKSEDMFNNYKKKDDLSDAFIMGYCVLLDTK